MTNELFHIHSDAPDYPTSLHQHRYSKALPTLSTIGNPSILQNTTIALFCSIKCPGDLILQTYDLALALRSLDITTISGFHSPMEQECLTLLLRGTQPIIHCPARSLGKMRLRPQWKSAIAQNRLLILSAAKHDRASSTMAQTRNLLVAAIADAIFIAHAHPDSKTAALAQHILTWGKPLLTLASLNNQPLVKMGARPIHPKNLTGQELADLAAPCR